jgi:transposase
VAGLIASPLVGMDETHVQVMQEPGRKNTTKSYMWVFRVEEGPPPGDVQISSNARI